VQAGGESPLINQLMSVDTRRLANESGSAALRRLYLVDLRNGAVATVANDLTRRTGHGAVSILLAV